VALTGECEIVGTASPVFRHFDRPELEREYDNRKKVPADLLEAYRARWRAGSCKARETMPCALDLAYGPSALEKLDVFMPEGGGRNPVQVYIHGGYWHFGDKAECSYVALGFSAAGVITVPINYGLAPEVRIGEQVRQCAAALRWVRDNIAEYGGDPEQIHVTGHSAGAHLAVMLATRDPDSGASPLPPGLVRSVCALSGIYDLEPVRFTVVNDAVRLAPGPVPR
jgi:arylformamidase